MKYKTTIKALRNYGYNVVRCGYCDLQTLFNYRSPDAYTSGVYGWNFDVYELDNLTICTGYRGMIGETIPHDIIRKYETLAKKIIYNGNWKEDKRKKLDKLISRFEKEVCKAVFNYDLV